MEGKITIPIIVMSFNRPEMLGKVLRSIKVAIENCRDFGPVYLFQDGHRSAISNREFTTYENIEACVEVFRSIFGDETIYASHYNLGVAMNFERAENFVFQQLDSTVAVFFEDDMLLGIGYLRLLKVLIDFALENDDVGMVSGYGVSPTTAISEQEKHKEKVVNMGHNWGFALLRRHWLERQHYLKPYVDLVRISDYRDRPTQDIGAWRNSLGFDGLPTSQDDCKNIVTLKMGRIRLGTYANFARYIGSTGVHMTEERFIEIGYNRACEIYYDDFTIALPNEAVISDLLFLEISARFRHRLISVQGGSITREMVKAGFRILLGREPESEGVISEKISLNQPIAFVLDLLSSFEFRDRAKGGMDLSSLVLGRRPVKSKQSSASHENRVAVDDILLLCQLFLYGHEGCIYEASKRSYYNDMHLIECLLTNEGFQELYRKALGSDCFFFTAPSSLLC